MEAQIGASTRPQLALAKFGELAAISSVCGKLFGRWVLQFVSSEVLTIGIVHRSSACALFASGYSGSSSDCLRMVGSAGAQEGLWRDRA